MILIKRFFFIVILTLSTFEVIAQSLEAIYSQSVPLKKHFTPEEYMGGLQCWSFDQDQEGILYVANNEGVLVFDGERWTLYEVPLATKVRAVLIDKKNRIFVGGQNQIGYFKYNKGLYLVVCHCEPPSPQEK